LEIQQLYTTLNTDFHPPSPPSSQNTHTEYHHIYHSGDINNWTGTSLENQLAHTSTQIPLGIHHLEMTFFKRKGFSSVDS